MAGFTGGWVELEPYAGTAVVDETEVDGEAWEVAYELGSIEGWFPYEFETAPMLGTEDGTDGGNEDGIEVEAATEDGSVDGGVD